MNELKSELKPGVWVDVIRGTDREKKKVTVGLVGSVGASSKEGVWVTLVDGEKALAIGVAPKSAVKQYALKVGTEMLQQQTLFTIWNYKNGKPLCFQSSNRRIGVLFWTKYACMKYRDAQKLDEDTWRIERLDIQKHLLMDTLTDGMFTHYLLNQTFLISVDRLNLIQAQLGQMG